MLESGPRFASRSMLVGLGLYGVFALTFASFRVANDGLVYFNFLRRFLGEDVAPDGYAYQFGVAFFNVPFYLAGRALDAAGIDSLLGAPTRETFIGIASNAALVASLWLAWRTLRRLELPAGPVVLFLAVFGSPLFYYTAFQPSYKHAVDALAFTGAAYLLLRATEAPSPWALLGLGACLGFLVTTRYANVALLPGMLLPFAWRREWRAVARVAVAFAGAAAILFALPAARGIPFERGNDAAAPRGLTAGILPRIPDPCHDTPNYRIDWSQCLRNKLGVRFDFPAPVRMLFSERRGLFLWTPLTAFSLVGMALVLARMRERRRFLAGLCVSAASLVAIHAFWGDFWTNGFSFSQRFLASLFPLYAIGVAELVRRWRWWAAGVLSACALFSLYAGFNHFIGYRGISEQDGLADVLTTRGDRGPGETMRLIGTRALERWGVR